MKVQQLLAAAYTQLNQYGPYRTKTVQPCSFARIRAQESSHIEGNLQ